MANTQKQIVGRVSGLYDLRTINKGTDKETSVIDFSVACSDRVFNKDTKEWDNGPANFNKVTAWGRLAENIEKSFNIGDWVFVSGVEKMKDAYTTKDGEERPAAPFINASIAGHEVTIDPAHSERVPTSDSKSKKSSDSSTRSVSKKTNLKKDEKKSDDLDLDDLDLDLDELNLDGDDEPTF